MLKSWNYSSATVSSIYGVIIVLFKGAEWTPDEDWNVETSANIAYSYNKVRTIFAVKVEKKSIESNENCTKLY